MGYLLNMGVTFPSHLPNQMQQYGIELVSNPKNGVISEQFVANYALVLQIPREEGLLMTICCLALFMIAVAGPP